MVLSRIRIGRASGVRSSHIPSYYYNLRRGLAAWRTGRTTAMTGSWPIVWIYGDSIGTGASATNPTTEGWAQRLKESLHTLYGNGGHYYQRIADAASVVTTANWNTGQYTGAGAGGWYHFSADTDNLQISVTGKYFDVYFVRSGLTGTFTVQLDSEAPVALGGTGALGVIVYTITAGTQGVHTIRIIPTNASRIYLNGVMARNSTGGLIVYNASVSGYGLGNYTTVGSSTTLSYQQRVMNPVLTIIASGINNYGTDPQLATATYNGLYTQLVSDCTAGGGSMLLVAENPDGRVKTTPQTAYDALIKAQAVSNNLAFINIDLAMGNNWNTASQRGYFTGNEKTHPNTAGHSFYYSIIANQVLR